ncbi:MAG: capsule assembly Wzi family protein [Spirochaetaceae bacterium]|nr:capsule assembly Wzi family protein [Spirochaetaceae bacterium]MCF7938746.1 capsule assembly Wzi family protein [Spirochaetales bacterium]
MHKMNLFLIVLIFLFSSTMLFGEMSFNNVFKEYSRTILLLGLEEAETLNFHTYEEFDNVFNLNNGPWRKHKASFPMKKVGSYRFTLLTPELWTSYNSEKPWGGNDGAVWQGKGVNSSIAGGIRIENKHFTFQLKPQLWFSQNQAFDIISTTYSSGYGDYWTEFDNLQRYGDDLYSDFSWGESFIRGKWNGFSLGLSSESIILGPGQKNNILLSNNAGGFPHIDLGTDGKVHIESFGDIEFRWIWGMLKESEFFDEDSKNDFGWITGTYAAFSPNIIPNFMIGFNHQYYKPLSEWDSYDLIRGIPFIDRSNSPTDYKDMMMSIPFSWRFPEVGFEFYGEWARNDNFANIEDLFSSPEHTHAFTLGINQLVKEWDENFLVMSLELSSLGQERTYEVRAAGPWYRHGWAGWTQGYTHNGQLLGAKIGPGSDSQWLKFTLYQPSGLWSFSIQRIAHDKDYYYKIDEIQEYMDEFSEFNIGIERVLLNKNYEAYVSGRYAFLMNNNYVNNKHLHNFHVIIGLNYNF